MGTTGWGMRRLAGRLRARGRTAVPAIVVAALAWTSPVSGQYYPLEPERLPSRLGESVIHGTGPDTLVLIPCASCRWRSFDELMRRNADRFTMIGVTLPGYGGTEPPALPMWTDSTLWRDHAVDALAELLDSVRPGRVVVVGHSYGTAVGLELAARRPEVVRGLVNLDGVLEYPPGRDTLALTRRVENARSTMEEYGFPLLDPDRWQPFNTPAIYHRPGRRLLYHGWFMATRPHVMMQYWRENLLADGNGTLRSLDIPILDVRAIRPWDPDSEETRRSTRSAVAAARPPGSHRLVFVHDASHFLMDERPEVVDRLLDDFVAGRTVGDVLPDSTDLTGLAPEDARRDFAAGIRALHEFWFEAAIDRFRAVQGLAPTFTLGYWGEAMALHRNPFGHAEPPVEEMRAVLRRLAPTPAARARRARTRQERMVLEALEVLIAAEDTPAERHPAYARAMGEVADAFPHDVEARAFHARALLLRDPEFGRSIDAQEAVAAEARRVLDIDPDHPGGLHYLIHGLDRPETAATATREADRLAATAKGASHAVHMPSHIYMQLGRWDDVVASNRAAVETSRRWLAMTDRPASGIDVHALDFLVYALLQQGREAEAREILADIRDLVDRYDTGTLRWMSALLHAEYAMELGRRADVPRPRSGHDSPGEIFALGLHALRATGPGAAREFLSEMKDRAPDDEPPLWHVLRLELEAGIAAEEGRADASVSMLRQAIALQRDLPRPNETPEPSKPPEELLGEILLELGRLDQAEAAFEAGRRRWPGRLATQLGLARVARERGDRDLAIRRYRDLLEQLEHARANHPIVLESRAEVERRRRPPYGRGRGNVQVRGRPGVEGGPGG